MAAFHILSYGSLGVSLFFSTIGLAVSIMAMCWFYCLFGSDTETPVDLMKFIYLRSTRCDAKLDWRYLNITNLKHLSASERELDVGQSFASRRTFIFLNLYITVNLALTATAIVAIYGLNRRKGGRYFNYYALCCPWIVMNFVSLALDLVATFFYCSDYFHVLWDFKYVLQLLGVKNPSRNLLRFFLANEENAIESTAMATTYTYIVASKLFFPLLVFFVLGLMSIRSMWEVVCDNKRIQTRTRRL